jgi:hypothetical protein
MAKNRLLGMFLADIVDSAKNGTDPRKPIQGSMSARVTKRNPLALAHRLCNAIALRNRPECDRDSTKRLRWTELLPMLKKQISGICQW